MPPRQGYSRRKHTDMPLRYGGEAVASLMRAAVLGALTVAVVACEKPPSGTASPAPEVAPRVPLEMTATPAARAAAAPSPPPAPATEPDGVPCAHPTPLSPQALAATWPSRLGQCVSLSTRIVRFLDATRALVQAQDSSFVVWMAPDARWLGTRMNTFIVMGSASVPWHGPTALPELLLQAP